MVLWVCKKVYALFFTVNLDSNNTGLGLKPKCLRYIKGIKETKIR